MNAINELFSAYLAPFLIAAILTWGRRLETYIVIGLGLIVCGTATAGLVWSEPAALRGGMVLGIASLLLATGTSFALGLATPVIIRDLRGGRIGGNASAWTIALWANIVFALCFLALGFFLFVLTGAFTACTSEGSPSVCRTVALIFFVAPLGIAAAPIIALTTFGSVARAFLWVYSICIGVGLFPFGTVVGYLTVRALREQSSAAIPSG